ncbi:alpha-protein kinase 1 isoform X2 [Brienomyrus brachyistius]|uniref:alpha-protein kinase 1 isoform X2 n=1 Tax=Brienomyrus brachyistius TaxID=42636 RepID=UPI0020B17DB3|nr:alpha-protein kinase 1 isoform X2 [Brienomyrus brachyistius]
MNNQEVVALLEESRQAAAAGLAQPSEEDKVEFQRCQASLSAELSMLLEEAVAMKWPFVPEKWQYKESVTSEDKTNLQDLISEHLPQLLKFLRASIEVGDSQFAISVVFLVDRFLYWADASKKLLCIVKSLHKQYPATPIPPQVVIRQARLSVNSGKIQKAEYILSSLINNCGATGHWLYHTDSERTLVQAVSIQIRGQVLQKLGLWLEAAELIWASLVGLFALPLPDKKGIGTSLGLLASILVSMSDKDFHAFTTCPQIDLSFLKAKGHRLLTAAEAAKMAVVYSQYTSLYVLSNVVIQGNCLLSFTFSPSCPKAQREVFLTQAKEAFEIGLLTKTKDEAVPTGTVVQARQICQEAMERLHAYSLASGPDKDRLSMEIMSLVGEVKTLFQIQPFLNSDERSFIPNSYKSMEEVPVKFSMASFSEVIGRFSQYHASVCDAFATSDDPSKSGCKGSYGPCITALKTVTETPDTACALGNHSDLRNAEGPPAKSWGKQREQRDSMGKQGGTSRACLLPSRKYASSTYLRAPQYQGYSSTTLVDAQCPTEDGDKVWENSSNESITFGMASIDKAREADKYRERTRSSTSSLGDSWGSLSSWQKGSLSDAGSSHSMGGVSEEEFTSLYAVAVDRRVDMNCPTMLTEENEQIGWSEITAPENLVIGDMKSLAGEVMNFSSCNIGSLSSWQTPCIPEKGHKDVQGHVRLRSTDSLEWEVDMLCPTEPDRELEEPKQHGNSVNESDIWQLDGCTERLRSSSSSLGDSWGSLSSWQKISPFDNSSSLTKNKGSSRIAEGLDERAFMSCLTESDELDRQSGWTENKRNCGPIRSEKVKPKQPGENLQPQTSPMKANVGVSHPSMINQSPPSVNFFKSVVPHTGQVLLSQHQGPKHPLVKDLSVWSGSSALHAVDPEAETEDNMPSDSLFQSSPVIVHAGACPKASPSTDTESSFVLTGDEKSEGDIGWPHMNNRKPSINSSPSCTRCLWQCMMVSEVPGQRCTLTEQDYKSLISGVCHDCLLHRLNNTGIFKLKKLNSVYRALLLKYSKAAGLWTAWETEVYVGDSMGKQGMQRTAFWVQFLHQEEMLGCYVGKEYLTAKELHYHLNDVERQMTAQHYVTEFNKRLYEKRIAMQIFFIPSEVLLILEGDVIVGCMTVEPYMLGEFVKLTNNTTKVVRDYKATDYAIAFGHFTFEFSGGTEVVVDLQGWVTANGKGLTYLTDPQIHSLREAGSRMNFGERGIRNFLEAQHGPKCNDICSRLALDCLGSPGKAGGFTVKEQDL